MKNIKIDFRVSEDLKDWLGNDNRSKKIRKILKWCMESYPDINDLLELI